MIEPKGGNPKLAGRPPRAPRWRLGLHGAPAFASNWGLKRPPGRGDVGPWVHPKSLALIRYHQIWIPELPQASWPSDHRQQSAWREGCNNRTLDPA
jgi:hypothetical protein